MSTQDWDPMMRRGAATIALGATITVAVVLGVHPPGSTEVHDDPTVFVEAATMFWILIHVIGSAATLAFVLVVDLWATARTSPTARAVAALARPVAVIGVTIGIIHMIAVDSIAPAFYADTMASGGEQALLTADLLVRVHAGTITAWTTVFWFGLQAMLAIGSGLDGERGWRLWVPAVAAVLALASIVVTLAEGVFTTVADMGLFRPSITLFLLWAILSTVAERRAVAPAAATV